MKPTPSVDCIERLRAILVEETDLLARGHLAGVVTLVEEKQRAASAVRDLAMGGSLRSMPEARNAIRSLQSVIDPNKKALEHALRIQRALIGVIVGAARSSAPTNAYGRTGNALTGSSRNLLARTRI